MAKLVQALTILSESTSSSGVSSPKRQSPHSCLNMLSGAAKQRRPKGSSSPALKQSFIAPITAAEIIERLKYVGNTNVVDVDQSRFFGRGSVGENSS